MDRITLSLSHFFILLYAISLSVASSSPLLPSKDPWYTAPTAFENAAPGTVLRFRHAPGNITSLLANLSAAYKTLYRTTDANLKPSWAVTIVLVPPHNSSSTSLLSYQIP